MFVCAFVVAHVGNIDIQHTLMMLKPNLTAHQHQPSCSFYCTSVSIPIYIRSARQHLTFILFVLSDPTAMHAFFSVLYGVLEIFINKIMFYLKDMVV